MDANASFVRRYALVLFFVLAYGFSWGTFFILGGPFVFPLGALLTAFIMASLTGGLKDLLSRLLRWRVGIQWYAAALLVGPAIALAALYLNGLLGAALPCRGFHLPVPHSSIRLSWGYSSSAGICQSPCPNVPSPRRT